MAERSTVSIEKKSLQRLAFVVPLASAFLYLSYEMLFGPCTISLPGLKVTGDLDFRFTAPDGAPLLSGHFDFGHPRPDSMDYGQTIIDRMDFCSSEYEYNTGCIEEAHNQRIRITYESTVAGGCYHIVRESLRCPAQEVKDCFDMGGAHWYGGFQSHAQLWPLEKSHLTLAPYVSTDLGFHGLGIGGVLERFFMSSKGVGIFVAHDVPLFVAINPLGDHRLCLSARYDEGYYRSDGDSLPVLNYTICHAVNIREIYMYMSRRFIPRPQDTPDPRLFTQPVWSTWAMFGKNITQKKVLSFAANISKFGFAASQLEIDDEWTRQYGDLEFDKNKFPDAAGMVRQLNKLGMRVTLWTHPFMNLDSQAFGEASNAHFVIGTRGSHNPALVRWWNGNMAALLDVTNPAAAQWYLKRLETLRNKYNVSSFKFDAGEALFVPEAYQTFQPMSTPNEYSRVWAELAYQADPHARHQEVRVGWASQSLPIFVRIFDRRSAWEAHEGGLQTVIPAVLTAGLLGYPFILPDMIGGSGAYVDQVFGLGQLPDRELFVRWLELNALMPAMQFSVPPWYFDEEVVNISRRYVELHQAYAQNILALAQESVHTGRPIVRPLWWVAPDDDVALTISSQFLLGDSLLVAPVLVRGARKRDIYLPQGAWEDRLRGGQLLGPMWLHGYDVQLDELPLFEKLARS